MENLNISSEALEIAVTRSISKYAESKGFVNKSGESMVEGTLLFYQGNDEYFPITLGARKVKDGVVVDLTHFHPDSDETEMYSQMKNDVLVILEKQYSIEVNSLPYEQHYEIIRENP